MRTLVACVSCLIMELYKPFVCPGFFSQAQHQWKIAYASILLVHFLSGLIILSIRVRAGTLLAIAKVIMPLHTKKLIHCFE